MRDRFSTGRVMDRGIHRQRRTRGAGAGALTLSLLIGFTAAPAGAQQAWSDLSIVRPGGSGPAPLRPRLHPSIDDDPLGTLPAPPAIDGTDDAIQPAGGLQGLRGSTFAVAPDRAQVDGEMEPPVSADLPVDGHIIVAEPVDPIDGREPLGPDPRLPADRAAFLSPPAGYDALAFQIELDPATDPRPARLALLQPFDPVGHRAGHWVVFPMLEAGVGGTSNVYAAPTARGDLIFDVRPTLLVVSDWQRHAVAFKATALASAYDHFASEDDRSYAFEARGRLDVSSDTKIEALVAHRLDLETRFSTFQPTDAARRTPYVTDTAAAAYTKRFDRLSIQVRGTLTGTDYQPVPALDGTLIDNTDRDLVTRDVAVRAAWSFNPALGVFAETAVNRQTYRAVPSDGIGRDSNGNRLRAGISFGTISQIWRGEAAIGYGRQHAQDLRIADSDGLLIDGNLGWRPSALTSLLFNARTDFVTSTLPGQSSAITHVFSLEARHGFSRRFTAIAGVSVSETDYHGIALVERLTTGTAGAEYALSHTTSLLGSYQHSIVTSTAPGGNATVDAVRVGMRWQP